MMKEERDVGKNYYQIHAEDHPSEQCEVRCVLRLVMQLCSDLQLMDIYGKELRKYTKSCSNIQSNTREVLSNESFFWHNINDTSC